MFWGLSEAIDFYSEYQTILKNKGENSENMSDEAPSNVREEIVQKNEINILLFGANDPRHLIKTMAKMYTHRVEGCVPVLNFYIIDACVEILARNIALLSIALESPKAMSIRNKVHTFMDVYGNSLIRASSHQYLEDKTKSLLKVVTDNECMMTLAPILNIDRLKYRERDGLENAFNFWLLGEDCVFQIQKYWNERLRKLLGTRYDYREGQFDWDLNMVLKERGGTQICSQEYRYWRECGIAFTFPEFENSKPNKTLCAGLARNGNRYVHRGFVGDVQTGPFAAFGLNTSDHCMLKSVHGENDYRSTDITERNLLELFHELATQTPYEHDLTYSRKYGAVRIQMGNRLTYGENDVHNSQTLDEPWINVDGVKINFLSLDDAFTLQESNVHWLDFFDLAFVGHNFFPFLKDSFVNILRPQSALILETKLLTTERKDIITNFEKKLMNFATGIQLESAINYNALNSKNTLLKFKKNIVSD